MLLFTTEALTYTSFFNPYSTTSYCAYNTQSVYKLNTFQSTANFLLANFKEAASSNSNQSLWQATMAVRLRCPCACWDTLKFKQTKKPNKLFVISYLK